MLRFQIEPKEGWERASGHLLDLWKMVVRKAVEKGYLDEEFTPPLFTSKRLSRALGTTHTHFRTDRWSGKSVWVQGVVVTEAYNYVTDDQLILRTLCHEMAHVIYPRHHHDYTWACCARDLGWEWGENGNRFCSSKDTKIVEAIQKEHGMFPKPTYKYQLICPTCGKVFTKYKTMCESLKRPRWMCSSCHTTLGYIDLTTNKFYEIKKNK